MIRKIVVALDGSAEAGRALDLAIECAAAFKAELILAHVMSDRALTQGERELARNEYDADLQQAVLKMPALVALSTSSTGASDLMIEASHELDRTIRTAIARGVMNQAEQRAKEAQVPTVKTILRDGHPTESLLAIAKEVKPDLFILGKRGLGGFRKLLLGSVSDGVSSSAECSVVTVR